MEKTRDIFKKIRDTRGAFHAQMGKIKNRKGMDLTEAEDIKKRWQEYTEKWQPTPVFLPGESQGRRSLVGFCLWGCTKQDTTEATQQQHTKKKKKNFMTQITTITHLEPDMLECEVNQASESITTNKVSGGDGSPVEVFQILNNDAVKVLHSICQQILKTQQWPQDWKRSVFIPIPKKSNAKEGSNYCTIALI